MQRPSSSTFHAAFQIARERHRWNASGSQNQAQPEARHEIIAKTFTQAFYAEGDGRGREISCNRYPKPGPLTLDHSTHPSLRRYKPG